MNSKVLVSVFLLGALSLFVGLRLEVSTDIAELMPTGQDRELAQLSHAIVGSELSRTLVVTLGAAGPTEAALASRRFEAALQADSEGVTRLASLQTGPPQGVDQALWEIYGAHRLELLAPSVAEARQRLSDEGLQRAARELKGKLSGPLSALVSRAAPHDPLLVLPRLFDTLAEQRAEGLALVDGRYVTADHYAVLLLVTKASAFDADAQRPLLAALDRALELTRHPDGERALEVTMETAGLARFAVRAQESIKADITRVSILSVIGLLALCLLLFRGLRLVLCSLLPVAVGMLTGTACVLLVFGRVHGLTLAFGASLIGVCIDYVVHFYVHQTMAPEPDGPEATLRRIRPGLLLGAGTTLVGFVALGASTFPGLQEVALFASAGILAALGSTLFLLPALVARQSRELPLRKRLADGLMRTLLGLAQRRYVGWSMIAAALVVGALGLRGVTWEDDLNQLSQIDPELIAMDERVRDRVGRYDRSRFVVAVGATEEDALEANEAVWSALLEAQRAGELDGAQGLAPLLPSRATQTRVAQVATGDPTLPSRLQKAFDAEGFDARLFQPFLDSLRQPGAALTWEKLLQSPVATMVRSFRVQLDDGGVGVLTFLRGVRQPEALAQRLDAVPGASYLDQSALMGSASRAYRTRTVQLVLGGLVAVLLVLLGRYRRPSAVAAAVAPALLAGGVTVAVLAAMDVPMNLLGLTSLLMVLSMGVDYGVFLLETASERAADLSATLVGLVVACLSTVFGFGLLALSDHPAMRIIGLVAAIGVSASLLLAPATYALYRPSVGGDT